MRIVQLLPTFIYGDAIGNDVIEIDKVIKQLGYDTRVYAEYVGKGINTSIVDNSEALFSQIKAEDIILYHLSTGTVLNDRLKELKCKIVIIYHNITPPAFFEMYSQDAVELSEKGIAGVKKLKDCVSYCLGDSEYNLRELKEYGYDCEMDVLPIVVPFEQYNQKPCKKIISKYKDGFTNIIFVGRIAPNKKQEDIIKSFYFYKKYINPKSRLFLVGSFNGMEKYKRDLDNYINALKLKDIFFTGHIKFSELLAYYDVADAFLCMSEHEGFCVPLLEAMYFRIPIIAYSATGVKDTLGNCGLQMEEKNCKIAAEMLNFAVTRQDLREQIVREQEVRLEEFSYEKTKNKFAECLKKVINS